MDTQKIKITKDMEQFHCFILLEDVKEKVRRLKSYGISDDELEELLHEEEIFPQLIVTKDYKIVIGDEIQCEVVLEPLVKAIYLLFLSHPEGIVLKCLPDYRREGIGTEVGKPKNFLYVRRICGRQATCCISHPQPC